MCHDDNRIICTELCDQFLDLQRCNRIERRRGLIHQQHIWLNGQGARDTQSLLLTTREAQGRSVQAVLDLIPKRSIDQALLDYFMELLAGCMLDAQAIGNVVED